MRKLILEDLSKQLGYSKTLISMVLNGKGNQYGISKNTQAIVLDAVAKMNYRSSKFGKSRLSGKSKFIGLIVTDISNPFYATIAKNIEGVLIETEYNLMVCSTEEDEEREKLLVEMMISQQCVDGLIVASTFKNSNFYDQPRFSKIPFVFIDRIVPMYNANYVVTDNYAGSVEIVNHLIAKGCKKIACFAITPLHLSTVEDRVNGYRHAILKNGIKERDSYLRSVSEASINEEVEKHIKEFLNSSVELDAIFALNNHIAVALLKVLKKKEFAKYSGIEIACFDDIELFNIIDKKIVSVSQPVEGIGQNSSALILDLISGKQSNKANVILSSTLIVR